MASTAAGGGAARGASNPPQPNPSDNGGPWIRLPPGKENKLVALADNTDTAKPNAAGSIAVPDLIKEIAKLRTLLSQKTDHIDKLKQQNQELAQNNSQRRKVSTKELSGKFDPTTKQGVHWGRENIGTTAHSVIHSVQVM